MRSDAALLTDLDQEVDSQLVRRPPGECERDLFDRRRWIACPTSAQRLHAPHQVGSSDIGHHPLRELGQSRQRVGRPKIELLAESDEILQVNGLNSYRPRRLAGELALALRVCAIANDQYRAGAVRWTHTRSLKSAPVVFSSVEVDPSDLARSRTQVDGLPPE